MNVALLIGALVIGFLAGWIGAAAVANNAYRDGGM